MWCQLPFSNLCCVLSAFLKSCRAPSPGFLSLEIFADNFSFFFLLDDLHPVISILSHWVPTTPSCELQYNGLTPSREENNLSSWLVARLYWELKHEDPCQLRLPQCRSPSCWSLKSPDLGFNLPPSRLLTLLPSPLLFLFLCFIFPSTSE